MKNVFGKSKFLWKKYFCEEELNLCKKVVQVKEKMVEKSLSYKKLMKKVVVNFFLVIKSNFGKI